MLPLMPNPERTSPIGSTLSTAAAASGQLFARYRQQVGRDDRRPDIALERLPSLPGAPVQTEAALEPGDARLDACPEAPKLLVDIRAAAHLFGLQAPLLGEAHVLDAHGFGGLQIGLRSKSAVQSSFERVAPIDPFLPIEHGFCQGHIGRIAFDDLTIEDQVRAAAGQTNLVAEERVAPVLDDDVGVILEDRHDLLGGRHLLTIDDAALGLTDDPFGQCHIALQLQKQTHRCRPVKPERPEPLDRRAGRSQRFARVLDQIDVGAPTFIFLAGILDFDQAPLGYPLVVMVSEPPRTQIPGSRLQSAQDPDTIVEQARIGRLVDVALDHRTVDSGRSPLFDLFFLGVTEHLLVDRFPSPIRQGLDVLVEGRLFEPLVSDADAAKNPDALTVDQVKRQLLVAEAEESHDHGRPQHLLGAHAFGPSTAIAGFPLAKILQHKVDGDRFTVQDGRDGLQLLGLDVAGDLGHQGHLTLPFFAHFVWVLFLVLVVLTIGWRLRLYYTQPQNTSTKCAFFILVG